MEHKIEPNHNPGAFRMEHDSMGEIAVPADVYWGAQTQRSLQHFPKESGRMPREVILALAQIKAAAARVNVRLGVLDETRAQLIETVAGEIVTGKWDQQFPLSLWQTGSGTQTNMNVNEVIANRGNALAGEALLHPNDHVNRSQSSNDTFPTAMHLATLSLARGRLLPALTGLADALAERGARFADVVKTGRTHLQDAVPISVGQEISAWEAAVRADVSRLSRALEELEALPIGGTAVGTGLNAPAHYDEWMCEELTKLTGFALRPMENKFYGLSMKSPLGAVHGAMKVAAEDLNKIANDIRLLSCGPRCGIGEYRIPANEPGSSIMPGKVNPTQVESLTMICLRVMANDVAVGMASASGQLQLNTYMPLLIGAVLESARMLAEGVECFRRNLVEGLVVDEAQMAEYLQRSLMLVTALSPKIGYDAASAIAHTAHEKGQTLREAALASGLVDAETYDKLVDPRQMID